MSVPLFCAEIRLCTKLESRPQHYFHIDAAVLHFGNFGKTKSDGSLQLQSYVRFALKLVSLQIDIHDSQKENTIIMFCKLPTAKMPYQPSESGHE